MAAPTHACAGNGGGRPRAGHHSGSIAACYTDPGAAESAALAATSATDNCTGGITYSASLTGPCATDITVTAEDAHGNSSSVTYSTHVDGTAPVVSNVPGSMDATLECPDTGALAAALAFEPSATDDCTQPPAPVLTADDIVGTGCSYVRTRTWTFTDLCGNASTFTQMITVVPVVKVSMRVLLEGPYEEATERMKDDLRFDGLLPVEQPYSVAPFNYVGNETASPGLFAASDPDNAIVDWVLIELRDETTPP
ncbi:MAG: hypothetical protein IPG92_15615 [Flavobacteriales bacterium]|nr:hypothetical protein [Flavobacteriales bacterium]